MKFLSYILAIFFVAPSVVFGMYNPNAECSCSIDDSSGNKQANYVACAKDLPSNTCQNNTQKANCCADAGGTWTYDGPINK